MALDMEVGLGPGDIVRWGPISLPPKRGTDPQFSARVYCGQTDGWIKMPYGTKERLGLRHIVLHGEPARPSPRGAQQPPCFRPMSVVATVAYLSYC